MSHKVQINKLTVSMYFLMILIFFFPFYLSDEAHAAYVNPYNAKKVTVVDENGNRLSGPEVDLNNVVPLRYNKTGNIGNDITIQRPKINYQEDFQHGTIYPTGTVFRIKNVGVYNGVPTVLAFTADKNVRLDIGTQNEVNVRMSDSYTDPTFRQISTTNWIEDMNGNPIKDSNTKILLPVQNSIASGWVGLQITLRGTLDTGGFTNILVGDKNYFSDGDKRLNYLTVEEGLAPKQFIFGQTVGQDGRSGSRYVINYIAPLTFNKFTLHSSYTGQLLPGSVYPINNTITYFDKSAPILIPEKYVPPVVQKTNINSGVYIDFSMYQDLINQADSSLYPNALNISVNMPSVILTKDNMNKVSITNADSSWNLSNYITKTSVQNGQMTFSIPNYLLQNLGNNRANFKANFNVIESLDLLMPYYNKSNENFEFPITAKNDQINASHTGIASMKMPKPTGTAIPQTVYLNTSTTDLDARNLVTNLEPAFYDDSVSVIGFKENKTFNQLGDQRAIVLIKSDRTGVVNEVSVPITVINARPLWGNVPFSFASGILTVDSTGIINPVLGEFTTSPWNRKDTFKIDNSLIKEINFIGKMKAPIKANKLFSGETADQNLTEVISINGLHLIDTSEVTTMEEMFADTNKLKTLDLSNWQTSQVTSTRYMFYLSESLSSVNLSNWNTENIKVTSYMFYYASNLKSLDLSGWNTKNVLSFGSMFEGANSIEELKLGKETVLKGTQLLNPKKLGDYTGKWEGIGNGTIENPQGVWSGTAEELETRSTLGIADTYIWAKDRGEIAINKRPDLYQFKKTFNQGNGDIEIPATDVSSKFISVNDTRNKITPWSLNVSANPLSLNKDSSVKNNQGRIELVPNLVSFNQNGEEINLIPGLEQPQVPTELIIYMDDSSQPVMSFDRNSRPVAGEYGLKLTNSHLYIPRSSVLELGEYSSKLNWTLDVVPTFGN